MVPALLLLAFTAHARTSDGAFTPQDLQCNALTNYFPTPCWLNDEGYTSYKFRTFDNDWGREIELPRHPSKNTLLDIASNATNASSIFSDGVGIYLKLPFGGINIKTDLTLHIHDQYVLTNGDDIRFPAWTPAGSSVKFVSPSSGSLSIPGSPRMLVYQTADTDWVSDIYMPDYPGDDQLIIIHSEAAQPSVVHSLPGGQKLADISKGQTLVYKYIDGKWTSIKWFPY
jgi:hypothetical protein